MCRGVVSPLSLLKNPMILIAVVGLAFVVGMPYIMDSSMFLTLKPLRQHLDIVMHAYMLTHGVR